MLMLIEQNASVLLWIPIARGPDLLRRPAASGVEIPVDSPMGCGLNGLAQPLDEWKSPLGIGGMPELG